jgi:hypothetical protein
MYLLTFLFIQYPLSFTTNITCDLSKVTKGILIANVATPLLEECGDDTHTPEMGSWESSGTPKTSEFDCRGQNTSF